MENLKTIFNAPFNEPLVHQVVVAYMSNARQGSVSQKSRAQVSGGGKKPWKQKGTGRARVGSSRNPIWRSGGVTFAASSDRNYKHKVHRKVYKAAVKSIISELLRHDRVQVLANIEMTAPRTKDLIAILGDELSKNVMIVVPEFDANIYLAARNLPRVCVVEVSKIDPVSLISYDQILIIGNASNRLQELLG